MLLTAQSDNPELPEGQFGLFRFTGPVEDGGTVYVDFGWHPPVASNREPLPGNLEMPKDSLVVRAGSG